MSTPQLQTRKPTGKVAFPFILVEGGEKVGKTFCSLRLSASPLVGQTFVLELDEPTADEYASLGDFSILEHNGTFSSILGQLQAACAAPKIDGKPNVVIIDTGTALWKLLSRWAESRARNSKKNQALLRQDPDAEVDVTMNLWNDATDRWYEVIDLLRGFEGIGVMIARSKETAKVVNGQPVANQTDYKIEAQKSVANEVSAVVRMEHHSARLMSVRKLNADIPRNGLVLDDDNPLEQLVFKILGAGVSFQASSAVTGSVGMSIGAAKTRLVSIFERSVSNAAAKEEASALWMKRAPKNVQEISDDQWKLLTAAAADRIVELKAEPQSPLVTGDDLGLNRAELDGTE